VLTTVEDVFRHKLFFYEDLFYLFESVSQEDPLLEEIVKGFFVLNLLLSWLFWLLISSQGALREEGPDVQNLRQKLGTEKCGGLDRCPVSFIYFLFLSFLLLICIGGCIFFRLFRGFSYLFSFHVCCSHHLG
jgi:hypothetical protein